jgi:thiol-disulfide isomerase/thioredoxin
MNSVKRALPWTIRIIVSFLFLLSAVAKLYPSPYFALSTFEVKQLYPMGFSEDLAAYFSRTLIGIELSLGILLLLPYYLKRMVIPATALMLLIFIAHLTIEILTVGNTGNCGCFGSLMPMTPLQAVIKNIFSVGLLAVLFRMQKTADKKQFLPILNVVLASVLIVFVLGMKKSSGKSKPMASNIEIDSSVNNAEESIDSVKDLTVEDTLKVLVNPGPKKKKSGFASIFPKIDEGKKILCFFAPDCDHCRATGKLLTKLKKENKDFPKIQIIFMDEAPEVIPDFFKFAGAEYPYYVMDIIEFWKNLGKDGTISRDVPGVMYLWNGNLQKLYHGTEAKQFSADSFKKLIAKEK